MAELTTGTIWGAFRIDSVLGRGPIGVVYRATRTSDGKRVSLKILDESLDEPVLRRIEDDTRRLMGLSHPDILRVETIGREGSRLFLVTELFEGRSLRGLGSRPLRDLAEMLLQAARAVSAAWMRLILHRNLKPENILVSVSGDVRLTDFGQFRDATPYWAPERKANQSPDLRGDLYSLGTIFKELIPAGEPDLDALLHHMTRVETFERVQMVEDVVSRLESWLSRHPASATPAIPLPPLPPLPPPILAPSLPTPPPVPDFPSAPTPESWERLDPELTDARTSIVRTLDAITKTAARIPTRVPSPPPPPPPPPPVAWSPVIPEAPSMPALEPKWDLQPTAKAPEPPPPPRPVVVAPRTTPPPPRPTVVRRSSAFGRLVSFLFWTGLAIGIVVYRLHVRDVKNRELEEARRLQEEGRTAEAKQKLEARIRQDKASTDEKDLLKSIKKDEWATTLAKIKQLDESMKYTAALDVCSAYLKQAGDSPPPEAVELQKALKTWTSAVSQAEQQRKYGADKRAADLLAKFGEPRAKDVQVILARWCDEDWTKTKKALDAAATENDPYSAIAEVDRFLKKPHEGGSHKKDAETRKLSFQADVDYAELVDRVDNLKARAPGDAVAALAAYLVKPHAGGTHRNDVLKQLDEIKEAAKATLFSGRVSIARLAASPGSKRIAFTSDGVKVLDLDTREELWSPPVKSQIRALSFGSEDRLVTGMSSKIQAWDLAAKKEVRSWAPADSFLVALAMKPDGKTVVGALSDGTLFTWDSDSDAPPKLEKEAATGMVAFSLSPEGSRVALAGRDKTLRVRTLSSGNEYKWPGPPVTVSALALSSDGHHVLAGCANGMITYWAAETGKSGSAITGHTGSVTCAAIAPDGAMLATGGADSQIRLTSTKDGSTIKVLTGHRGRISSIAFVPAGLLSSSSDGSVRIWALK